MIKHKNSTWHVLDKLKLLQSQGAGLTDETLDKFGAIAIKVLSEKDPALELEKDQRFAAGIYGKERHYSDGLRKSVAETLAILCSNPDLVQTCSDGKQDSVAFQVVNTLLHGADGERWASLNNILPLLAEASPDAFFKAVDAALSGGSEPFTDVFAEESSDFGGRIYSTGLLWALESLAWKEDYLVRVCRILVNLMALDPGGNWMNRPSNSLVTILLPWLPQTCAKTEIRHAAVKTVIKEQPDLAWSFIQRLLPQTHSTSSGSHKPEWRPFIPEDWKKGVTEGQYWTDTIFYSKIALDLASSNVQRLSELIDYYFRLHLEFRTALREQLTSEEVCNSSEEDRLFLWSTLTTKTQMHRKFADSDVWAETEESLEELDAIADKLKPEEPEIRHRRLFSGYDIELYDEKDDYEVQRERLKTKRIEAVKEIVSRGGTDALIDFARNTQSPDIVGAALGTDEDSDLDVAFIPKLFESGEEKERKFIQGFIQHRFYRLDWDWVDSIDKSSWKNETKAQFFILLPFCSDTWSRVESELGADDSAYWKNVYAMSHSDKCQEMDQAVAKLISNKRADAVISWLNHLVYGNQFYPELAMQALEAWDSHNQVDSHAIGKLIKELQKHGEVDEERLAAIEIKFLQILGQFYSAYPKTLHYWLAERPSFFCEIIQMIYRSSNEKEKDEQVVDEATKNRASNGYKLLSEWNTPPGSQRDNNFNPESLEKWLESVKKECLETGHWEVAALKVGEVLYYAPRGEDGLWIDPVCEILDSKETDAFCRGLWTEIYNSRGAHGYSGGKEEIEMAEKYETMAELAEGKGFSRLGEAMRNLGKTYRYEAERSIERWGED